LDVARRLTVKQILGGVTGNPIFLERQTTRYRNELERITQAWLQEAEGAGVEELGAAMLVLVNRLQNAAERHFRRAFKLGLGNRPLSEEDERKIQLALASNLSWLRTSLQPGIERRIQQGMDAELAFVDALENSSDFAANRAGLYAGAFWTLIWVGRAAAMERKFGPTAADTTPVLRVLDPRAAHCPSCPPKAREYPSWNTMLMFTGGLPGDGSDVCLCITTGESRVLTQRGHIPIQDVLIGDSVITHKGRWRKVLKTTVAPSGPNHKQARITAPTGNIIGCTQDHLWFTPDGWRMTVTIADFKLSMYNYNYAEKLYGLRQQTPLESETEYLYSVCECLRLWEGQRSPSEKVHLLRDVHQSQRTMGRSGHAHQDVESDSQCGLEPQMYFRPADRELLQPPQSGRQGLRDVLGRGRQEALHSSLSVAMDQREWANSRRNGLTPQEWRLLRRQDSELGDYDTSGSYQTSSQAEQSSILRMSDMPNSIYEKSSERTPQQILLAGMLPLGTPLYDLTIEEDHSFIVEGLISHNSNCRCRIKILDAGRFVYTL
jgi:hypothetical protein